MLCTLAFHGPKKGTTSIYLPVVGYGERLVALVPRIPGVPPGPLRPVEVGGFPAQDRALRLRAAVARDDREGMCRKLFVSKFQPL